MPAPELTTHEAEALEAGKAYVEAAHELREARSQFERARADFANAIRPLKESQALQRVIARRVEVVMQARRKRHTPIPPEAEGQDMAPADVYLASPHDFDGGEE